MLDWEGNITQKNWRDKTRVNEDHKSNDFESLALDDIIDANIASAYAPSQLITKNDYDDLISSIYEETFWSKLYMSIGVVKPLNFGNKNDVLFRENSTNNIFHPKIGSLRASRPTTISAEHLSKIWRIKPEVASKVIAQNSHLYPQRIDTELSKIFSTNDRMLRYKNLFHRYILYDIQKYIIQSK